MDDMSEYVFVYDHRVMQGAEESDIDPSTAILFFYPTTVSLQEQHEISSQLMGIVKLIPALLLSSVRLFRLAGGCVACIHPKPMGQLTFAYLSNRNINSSRSNNEENTTTTTTATTTTSSSTTSAATVFASSNSSLSLNVATSDLCRKAENLYRIMTFYHGCPNKLFQDDNQREERLIKLRLAMVRYIAHVTYCGAILPSIMQPLAQYNVNDSLIYQKVISLLDECSSQWPQVIAGLLAYKGKLVASQIPLSIVNRLFLIKMRHIQSIENQPEFLQGVAISESFVRPGVSLLRCLISIEEWNEILALNQPNVFNSKVNVNHDYLLESSSFGCSSSANDNNNATTTIDENRIHYCCDERDHIYIQIYTEAHSDVFVAFILKDSYVWTVSDLDEIHRYCFPVIGDLEFQFLSQDLQAKEPAKRMSKTSATTYAINETEVIVYDNLDNTLEGNEVWTEPSMAADTLWNSQVCNYVALLHGKLQEDPDVCEVKISLPDSSQFHAQRLGSREKFTVKRGGL